MRTILTVEDLSGALHRLLHVCVSNPATRSDWLSIIAEDEHIYDNITFILKSSTNSE